MSLSSLVTDAILRTWVFTDVKFSTLFQTDASGLLSSLIMILKKQRDGVYILLCRMSRELRCFSGNFLEFPKQVISRVTANDYF